MENNQDIAFNLRQNFYNYIRHWRWFVVSGLLSLLIAFIYLRYATPQFSSSTSILVKDDKKGGVMSELSAFSDMGFGSSVKSNVDNEIEVLKSRTIVESTVKALELNVSIFEKGFVNTIDVYKREPINVHFVNRKSNFYFCSAYWEFIPRTKTSFELVSKIKKTNEGVDVISIGTRKAVFKYGEVIPTSCGNLIITRSLIKNQFNKGKDKTIFIAVSPLENVVNSFRARVGVTSISKTSSVVNISLNDSSPERTETFLNKMIEIYNDDASADKNFISENTSRFISNRLILISRELNIVEENVETFKKSNGLTDIDSEAKLFIEGSNEYSNKAVVNEIKLNVVVSLLDFLKNSQGYELLPANVIDSAEAAPIIGLYNKTILERNRVLQSSTSSNPAVLSLDDEIFKLRAAINESLRRMQSSLNIEKRNLTVQERLIDSKIQKIPVQERKYRDIERQQKVKEELYLYLLEKREETAISLAATAPNARVIDVAIRPSFPVSTKRNIVFLIALFIGLLVPGVIIYIKEILDTKVRNRVDVTSIVDIPFLGEVPSSSSPNTLIEKSSRDSTAESLRIVRSNIDFMLNSVVEERAKLIFVTSTIPGEGKTFLSVNLGSILAQSGSKVLVIGMDIRKPKLNVYFNFENLTGLVDYLSSKNAVIQDYIHKVDSFKSFDVLLGGSVPPNPTELLMSKKIDELFLQLKSQYDYIVVDTAPVSLVSDTMVVARHADCFVYVVRANYLDKRMLSFLDTASKENKLPNVSCVLNDTKSSKGYGYGGYGYGGYGYGGYGYGGYGYGGEDEVKVPWYKKIFKM
jgi:tyrosine-protein kinase Etk/Wzc